MDLMMSVCDSIVVLIFGKVIAAGTPKQVPGEPRRDRRLPRHRRRGAGNHQFLKDAASRL